MTTKKDKKDYQIQKGSTLYKDYLDNLSPEERKLHWDAVNAKRKLKRSMRETFDTIVKANEDRWLSLLNNRLAEIVSKGTPSEVLQAMDRLMSKPKEISDQNINAKIENLTVSFEDTPDDNK